MRNKISLICLVACFTVLSACGQSTPEKIHKQLESSVTEEKAFNQSQKEVAKLEKAEKKIFDKITNLNMEKFADVKKNSKKAIENIEKRSSELKKEKESMEASEEEFKKVTKLIEDLEKDDAKKQGEKMSKAMNARYKTYEKLNKEYQKSLEHEEKFYKLLSNKDAKADEVNKQLNKLNEVYEDLLEKNKLFNEETKKYNELKNDFYKVLDIDIEYTEK